MSDQSRKEIYKKSRSFIFALLIIYIIIIIVISISYLQYSDESSNPEYHGWTYIDPRYNISPQFNTTIEIYTNSLTLDKTVRFYRNEPNTTMLLKLIKKDNNNIIFLPPQLILNKTYHESIDETVHILKRSGLQNSDIDIIIKFNHGLDIWYEKTRITV